MRKIILVGYMAVGKSTIGKILAQKTQMKFIDLDQSIEESVKSPITEIFKQHGEIYFRKLEHLEFQKCINNQESVIISTGGGTPCYADNHLLLNAEGVISIYLKASIEELYQRLKLNSDSRPLVGQKTEEELKEFIAKNLFERSYFYNQAKYKITVDGKNPETIAAEIFNLLH